METNVRETKENESFHCTLLKWLQVFQTWQDVVFSSVLTMEASHVLLSNSSCNIIVYKTICYKRIWSACFCNGFENFVLNIM